MRETTMVDGMVYDVETIRPYAEKIPIQTIPLSQLRGAVAAGHAYWQDREGHWFGPHQILQSWDKAQKNPTWTDHVATIRRSDLENPIWMTAGGQVFDGMHRLTRAFLDGVEAIKVRIFSELPDSAVVVSS